MPQEKDEQENKLANEVGKDTRSALWEHYYLRDDEILSQPRRKLRRITKKEIIVRTLKNKELAGGAVGLQELSELTGMSPHELSGHLTHLVHEGKVVRTGRGLFILKAPTLTGVEKKSGLKKLVQSVAAKTSMPVQEKKFVITKGDHSENRRIMMGFLSDALSKCDEVELSIKSRKDPKGKGGSISIELRAR